MENIVARDRTVNKTLKECIDKLHEPFDAELRVVVADSYEDQVIKGFHGGESHLFPEWLYARRLDEVFDNNWSSRIDEVELWGETFFSCTVEVVLPDGSEFQRSGIAQGAHPFAYACELIGIGGDSGSILICSRRLNKAYGLDWNIDLNYLEEEVICELSVGDQEGKRQTRSGMGKTDIDAFANACEMFGISPHEDDDIPF